MNRYKFAALIVISLMFLNFFQPTHAQESTIYSLVFYSPTCPHCYKVLTEDLKQLYEIYGDQLVILGIDVTTEEGGKLYQAAIQRFQVPEERQGVPMLIVGETVLVGSYEIPLLFPDIIDEGLTTGGIDWPDFPELFEVVDVEVFTKPTATPQVQETEVQNMAALPATDTARDDFENEPLDNPASNQEIENNNPTSDLTETAAHLEQMTFAERFEQDRIGNTISVLTLIGMVCSVVWVCFVVIHPDRGMQRWPDWMIPLLVGIGMVVSIYMSYVEITQTDAICGPVGDCNTVQQSSYASLFGIIPVGMLGIVGNLIIGTFWAITRFGKISWRKTGSLALWILCFFGTLFSIYLTFLEPFVIGATCAWCLTSAVVMTLLLWTATASRENNQVGIQKGGRKHLRSV